MLYLTVVFIICFAAALFSVRYPLAAAGELGQRLPNPAGFLIPAILFTLFSGLRNNLGDTFYNMHGFAVMGNNLEKPRLGDREYLYGCLTYFLRQMTDKPQILIYIGAVISCVPVIYILYRYSFSYELGIFLFVATTYYTFSFNGMRQYMAAGILIFGAKYMFSQDKRSWLKYALIVVLASAVHSSAIIMLPIYFIVRRKAWSPTSYAIIFFSMLATLLFDAFLPGFLRVVAESDFSIYEESGWFTEGIEKGSSLIRVIVVLVPVVIACFSKERLRSLGFTGDVLINLSVINFCFYLISLYNWIFARFAIYTSVYYILLTVWLVKNSFKQKDEKLIYIITLVLYSTFFWFARYSIAGYKSNFFGR